MLELETFTYEGNGRQYPMVSLGKPITTTVCREAEIRYAGKLNRGRARVVGVTKLRRDAVVCEYNGAFFPIAVACLENLPLSKRRLINEALLSLNSTQEVQE